MKKCEKLFIFFYNLNVIEVRDSDFKNAFPGIFNFNVGILFMVLVTDFVDESLSPTSVIFAEINFEDMKGKFWNPRL